MFDRVKLLKLALRIVGVTFIAGIYALTIVWPSGWKWHTGESYYPAMILGVYATLGVFLLIASRNPLSHLSLIWFTVWSSVVHAGIMAVQSLMHSDQMGHLWGDVLALFFVAGVLALLTPRSAEDPIMMDGSRQIATSTAGSLSRSPAGTPGVGT